MCYTPKQLAFIEEARQKISDVPYSRLTNITREVLERNNYVFDAHCHLFDGKCINAIYLAIRMLAGVPEKLKPIFWRLITGNHMPEEMKIVAKEDLVEDIYEDPSIAVGANDISRLIVKMEENLEEIEMTAIAEVQTSHGKLGLKELLRRYRYILKLLKSNKMEKVYTSYRDKYGVHHIAGEMDDKKYELITVALGMDLNIGWDNKIKKSQKKQNEELANLARNHPVLPFLPLDPRRADFDENDSEPNLYDVFLDAFSSSNSGFFGVKCYPALGYLPSDSRLKPIFKICAEKKIPVMTHCGGNIISTFQKDIVYNRDGTEERPMQRGRKARAMFLNEPKEWKSVLDKHEGLKVCFGHFGSEKAWESNDNVYSKRIDDILTLMTNHNVYADFSFNLDSPKATSRFIEKLTDPKIDAKIRTRVMFGTDFWVILPTSDLNLDQRYFLNKLGNLKDDLLRNNVLHYLGLY